MITTIPKIQQTEKLPYLPFITNTGLFATRQDIKRTVSGASLQDLERAILRADGTFKCISQNAQLVFNCDSMSAESKISWAHARLKSAAKLEAELNLAFNLLNTDQSLLARWDEIKTFYLGEAKNILRNLVFKLEHDKYTNTQLNTQPMETGYVPLLMTTEHDSDKIRIYIERECVNP